MEHSSPLSQGSQRKPDVLLHGNVVLPQESIPKKHRVYLIPIISSAGSCCSLGVSRDCHHPHRPPCFLALQVWGPLPGLGCSSQWSGPSLGSRNVMDKVSPAAWLCFWHCLKRGAENRTNAGKHLCLAGVKHGDTVMVAGCWELPQECSVMVVGTEGYTEQLLCSRSKQCCGVPGLRGCARQ